MIHLETATRLNPTLPVSRSELMPLLLSILDYLGLEDRELSLECVDDRKIASVNEEFLGCTGPTNILSFPASPEESETVLGELILSLDTLTREIHLYGQDPKEHLVRLLTHGILHLAGYDHGETMYSLTDMVVDALGGMGEVMIDEGQQSFREEL